MSMFAGVCETNITPPVGVWLCGYDPRASRATGVHDELYARALVLDDGHKRLCLVTADLIAMPEAMARSVRADIAGQIGTTAECVMLNCSHTHAGPNIGLYRRMGEPDIPYVDVLRRKIVGAAKQASNNLRPAHLTYGETSAQIGVNRRQKRSDNTMCVGVDYAGPVSPVVQTLCVNGADGRTFALLFSHACHPTTMGGDNYLISAEWPGAAAEHLKRRFASEGKDTGIDENALPLFLQGCCGNINAVSRGSWDAVAENGRAVAEAAHTARWSAHGRLEEKLDAKEIVINLELAPLLPKLIYKKQAANLTKKLAAPWTPDMRQFIERQIITAEHLLELASVKNPPVSRSFAIQRLDVGGVTLLGFPAEMFSQYQLDFTAQFGKPLFCLSFTNGCHGYIPIAAEFARGGYEIEVAPIYYGLPTFTESCEAVIRDAVYSLLKIEAPDGSAYSLVAGCRV